MNDSFLNRVADKIERLGLRETALREELDEVTRERGRYQAALEIYREEMESGSGKETFVASGALSDDKLATMTIAEAAVEVLTEAKAPMRMRDIVRRLKRAGTTKAKGTGAYSSVLKTMDRRGDLFAKESDGRWVLVRWRDMPSVDLFSAPANEGRK